MNLNSSQSLGIYLISLRLMACVQFIPQMGVLCLNVSRFLFRRTQFDTFKSNRWCDYKLYLILILTPKLYDPNT